MRSIFAAVAAASCVMLLAYFGQQALGFASLVTVAVWYAVCAAVASAAALVAFILTDRTVDEFFTHNYGGNDE